MLSSGTPGIPSMLLAAFPIAERTPAEQLHQFGVRVMESLQQVGLAERVMSSVSDGAVTERSAQNLAEQHWDKRLFCRLHTDDELFSDIDVFCSYIGDTPTFFSIDWKHTGKNTRSAVDSGARALLCGMFVVLFCMILECAGPGRPLLRRDVEKRDRQDDRSTDRFLSSTMFKHVATTSPEKRGFQAYLFVMGELLSAVQSRTITPLQRIRMLLMVLFFLEGWERFINAHPDYRLPTHCLASDTRICIRRLATSMIGLAIRCRDLSEASDTPVILFPWVHTTEQLDHFFGIVRTQVKDFDIMDFLQASGRAATLQDLNLKKHFEVDKEARAAAGYQHTYFEIHGMDLLAMAASFTNKDLATSANNVRAFTSLRHGSLTHFAHTGCCRCPCDHGLYRDDTSSHISRPQTKTA